jgi:hypothetical protein
MRYLFALLTSLQLFAATGDVVGGAVMENGWIVLLRIEGGATNGTYDFGFVNTTNSTFNNWNNDSAKLKITVNSPGYATSGLLGATNVWSGTAYGTKAIRFPYPDEAFPRVYIDGSDVIIYVSLDDYIFATDTGMTATIGAGLYASSTATNNAASITLTNLSAQTVYPKVIPNWRTVPHQMITSASMRLHGMAWHAYAQQGQPVARMAFFVTDESGDVLTNIQTRMQIDHTRGETIKSGEYVADFDLSTLTDNNLLRLDFAAYPYRGDSSAIFDTRSNLYTWPAFLPCSITNFYRTTAYSAVAVVATNGVDVNGNAYPAGTDPATIPSGDYFLLGTAAADAIQIYNNANYGHDDIGGGIIYYRAGIDTPFGATTAVGGTPKAVITLKPYPGDAVVWTNNAGTDDLSDRITVDGTGGSITISPAGSSVIMFNGVQHLQFTNCIMLDIANASAPVSNSTEGHTYYTGNLFSNWVAGLPRTGAGFTGYCTMWNNNLFGQNAPVYWMNHVGNYRIPSSAKTAFTWSEDSSSTTLPIVEYNISYNNYIMGLTNATVGTLGNTRETTIGKAMIQNVFETGHSAASLSVVSLSTLNATNILWFHNVCVGARNQWFYNASPNATGAVMNLNYVKNFICTVLGEATDIDGPTFDADRTNDWSMRWRVGGSGVFDLMTTNTFAHSQPDFNGVRSFRPLLLNKTPAKYAEFVDDRSFGSGTVSQNGNYRLQTDSPVLRDDYTHLFWGVPFDMDGLPRGRFDPPGAFAAGNFRRGGFF